MVAIVSKQSKIIISKARKGMSYSEIAREMGIPYNIVKCAVYRDKQRRELRRKLQKVESFEQVKKVIELKTISSLSPAPAPRPGLIRRIINFFTGRV